ncbi:MAG: hypothetical protein JO316_23200 [Abitibacteriaceae bacterium]|nr:hypothetical protein [Abditibacteriaceae bacterium]MBV9868272.1 hypothetical protein [Abditibacteriaceae bacterium]
MKYVEQKSFVSQLKDAAIITAAGVTVVGTVLWLKREAAMQQLTEEAGAEQMRIRTALERLAAAVERVEGHLQDLAKASSSNETPAEAPTATGSRSATAKRAATAQANGTALAEEDKPASARRSRNSSASKSGSSGQKTNRSRKSSATNGNTASAETQAEETSAATPSPREAA